MVAYLSIVDCTIIMDVGSTGDWPKPYQYFFNLMPVFTAIIASLWLSEQWTIYHSIGGVMILVGIVMAQKKTVKAPATRVESA